MTNVTDRPRKLDSPLLPDNDWRLLLKLVPYARRSGRLFIISFSLLIPLAISNAVQPLIIGQAISKIRNEKTWEFVSGLSMLDIQYSASANKSPPIFATTYSIESHLWQSGSSIVRPLGS
jgi:hypothetical protein